MAYLNCSLLAMMWILLEYCLNMSWQELCLIHCFLSRTAMLSSIYHLVNVCWFNPNNFYVTTICWKVIYISESSPVWGAFFLTSSCNLEGSMTCDLLWPARWRQTWQIPLWAEPGSFLVERVIVLFPSPTPTVTISLAKESLSLCLRVIGKARSAWQPVWIHQWDRHRSVFEATGLCCFLLT